MKRIIYGSLSVLTAVCTVFLAAKAEVFEQDNSAASEEAAILEPNSSLDDISLSSAPSGTRFDGVGLSEQSLSDKALTTKGSADSAFSKGALSDLSTIKTSRFQPDRKASSASTAPSLERASAQTAQSARIPSGISRSAPVSFPTARLASRSNSLDRSNQSNSLASPSENYRAQVDPKVQMSAPANSAAPDSSGDLSPSAPSPSAPSPSAVPEGSSSTDVQQPGNLQFIAPTTPGRSQLQTIPAPATAAPDPTDSSLVESDAMGEESLESQVVESDATDAEVVVPASGAAPTKVPAGGVRLPATPGAAPSPTAAPTTPGTTPIPATPVSPNGVSASDEDADMDDSLGQGVGDPGLEEPSLEKPGLEEPGLEEPGLEEPGLEEPGLEEPGLEEPGLEEPGLEEPGLEEPGMDDSSLEEPGMDGSGMDGSDIESPAEPGELSDPLEESDTESPASSGDEPDEFDESEPALESAPLPPSDTSPNDSFESEPEPFPESRGPGSGEGLIGEGFTPFQLSYLALGGGLQEEGIPGGDRLVRAYKQGDLSADDVVAAGAASNRLGTAASDKDDYTKDVDRFLKMFRRDARDS